MTVDEWIRAVTILDCDECGVWTVTIKTEIDGGQWRLCQQCRDHLAKGIPLKIQEKRGGGE